MKIGIITFHRPHNYGAVIQAYAMQKIFKDLGYQPEIIDFMRSEQVDYTSLYSKRHGVKSIFKNALMLPFHKERKVRAEKFNCFIDEKLVKSKEIYKDETEVKAAGDIYDIYFTGSDQVWNPTKESDISTSYFLDFVKDDKKRYAYAPSIGTAEKDDLVPYKSLLERYSKISCREQRGADILSELLGKEVPVVLDPTLLVKRLRLEELVVKKKEEPYIFYYSLDGFDKRTRNVDILSYLKKRYGYKIKMITPEWLYHYGVGEQIGDAGIEDFLSLIYNAEFICTNSFHGTALSLAFGKPFYVLENRGGNDDRKQGLLKSLHLENRVISNIEESEKTKDYHLNYDSVNLYLDKLRDKSLAFIRECLEES